MWNCCGVTIENCPFEVMRKETRECQFGSHYFKKRERTSDRVYFQGTRKINCPARIEIREYKYYPDYALKSTQLVGKQLRLAHEKLLKSLKQKLHSSNPIQVKKKYFISLPTKDSHENFHPTGIISGPAQKVHPMVSKKIEDLVREGAVDANEVQRSLREFVKNCSHELSKPSLTDRAYYPTLNDIRNHIYKAKIALQLSKLDQENLTLKMEEWSKSNINDHYLFRPYLKRETNDVNDEVQFDLSLLWISQQKWQKELIARYGNHISLIDATYRTMKYELPLFFVCVRTNVGYSVAAQFITQSECTEQITEALNILKEWNPNWKPPFFLSDFSDAEFLAIKNAFPKTIVYGCDFHREQAWTRWVQDRKNALDKNEADLLLELLRACAWAQPGPNQSDLDVNYKDAVSELKKSSVWKNNNHVRNWLSVTWLQHPEVRSQYSFVMTLKVMIYYAFY